MAGLFAVMPRPEAPDYTAIVSGGLPAAFLQVFYTYLGAAMAVASALFWRVSRLSPRGTVRWGFWLLATGTSGAVAYALYQTCYLALRVFSVIGDAQAARALGYGRDLEALTILLILAGLPVPALGTGWQNARDLAALAALRGLTGADLGAAAEACWLDLAIRAARSGAPRSGTAHVLPDGQTLPEEIRWLRRVAAAQRSAHVRAVTADLTASPLLYQEGSPR